MLWGFISLTMAMESEDIGPRMNVGAPMVGAAIAFASMTVDAFCQWLSSVLPMKTRDEVHALTQALVSDDLGSIEALSKLSHQDWCDI